MKEERVKNEDLTKAAQQALEALRNAQQLEHLVDRKMQRAAIAALERALTHRPTAQTEREAFEAFAQNCPMGCYSVARRGDDYDSSHTQIMWDAWQARASLPTPQQGIASNNPTPEPLIVKGAMAGMVDAQVRDLWPTKGATLAPQQATPEPHLFIGACITDGRLHATVQRLESNGNVTLVATAEMDAASLHGLDCMAQMTPATPEPVGEPVAYREKLTGRLCEPEDTHRRKFPMCYEPLFTRPAPGVPESPRQLRKRFEQHMRDAFACKDTAFLSIDGWKTYLDGGMDNHWRTWIAAAQANGAGHE